MVQRLSLLAGVLIVCACGSAWRGEPKAPPVQLTSAEARRGEQVFMMHCQQCHPGGTAGLGPAINDKPLPGALIRFQVRNGLGAMPAFDSTRIDERDLDALVAYLLDVRRSR